MMRALWTAASGMNAQQTCVDTVSNNLANINTTGYKKQTAEFKSLLYQTIQEKQTDADGNEKPVSAQVGLGVRTSAVTSQFTQGSLTQTDNTLDLAIDGSGFFMIQLEDGSIGYTRNGSFQASIGEDGLMLTDSEGNAVLDDNGDPIMIPDGVSADNLIIDSSGLISYPDEDNNATSTGIQLGIAQFSNSAGLEKTSESILKQTDASGEPVIESQGGDISSKSTIRQGYLEASNVQAVDEMVDLIVAQRAYEMNSKTITAADEMLQQANNLRS